MDILKNFFAGHNKDAIPLSKTQQSGLSPYGNRSLQAGNGDAGAGSGQYGVGNNNLRNQQDHHHSEAKRIDSDGYFYIMWRS